MSRCFKIVAIAAYFLAFAFTPLRVPAAPNDPVELDAIVSQTGFAAFLGNDSTVALHLIEAQVNKTGGIQGHPLHFNIVDDHSDPQTALQLANQFIGKHVPIFLGPGIVAQCGAILPTVATTGPVMFCFSPALQPAPGSYGFASGPSIPDYIVATVRYLRERGWKRLALITSTDASGQDGDRAVDAALRLPENKDVTLVDRQHFNANDLSAAAQMTHIKGSGADAAIFWTSGTPFGTLLHGAADAGLSLPIATTVSNLNYAQLASYSAFAPESLYMVAPPFAAGDQLPPSAVKRSVANYLSLIGAANIKPAQGHVTVWDSALLVIDAYKHLGVNPTADQLRDYLNGISGWAGVNGMYDFKKLPQRGVGNDWLFTLRWNRATNTVSVVSKAGGIPTKP